MAKAEFLAVSIISQTSEIIIICWFAAQKNISHYIPIWKWFCCL